MQYYLLLKEHNNTGLKYLCKFTEGVKIKCPFKYKGSGKYWKRHLNKHGNNINTNILYKGNSEQELSAHAILWSNIYDVVNNKEFANLIPENGLDGGGLKGIKLSEERKRKISLFHKGKKRSKETIEKIRLGKLGVKRPDLAKKNKLRVWTENMRKNASLSAKKRKPVKRNPLTQETKDKISKSVKKYYILKPTMDIFKKK